MPKVSIIIPLHNAAPYIQATLTSCIQQTHKDIEIIVVENGSSDNSYEVAQVFVDKRLQLWQIPKANAAKARNFGYKKSTGDFIMFLDADDIIARNKIEVQLLALDQKPEGWVASCPWAKFKDNIAEAIIEMQEVWSIENPVEWCINSWMGGGMMVPGCWLIPRVIIERAGLWDERLTLHDDGEFMCRVLLASKGNAYVNSAEVFYRQVDTSLSRQHQSLQSAESALRVYKSYEQNILKYEDNRRVRKALVYNYRNFIYEYYSRYKVLIDKAHTQIVKLNITEKDLPLVGGEHFQKLSKRIGFKTALNLKALKSIFYKDLN